MIYLISDTHFNHKNIILYENRPFGSISEMNEKLIQNWNEVVKPEDTIIHLGDIGLGNESSLRELIPNLNGHKILIKGNHDGKSNKFYLDCGFEEVNRTKMMEINGIKIFLSHQPESRPGDGQTYDIHLYGHVHSKGSNGTYPTISKNGACICVERWNYYPVSLDEVLERCSKCEQRNVNI